MERQNTPSQGMSECRNVEVRKTPFGVGFKYQELECRKHFATGMPKSRMSNAENAERSNCEMVK
jgi:hypothetical protein